ncbi:unnamed protein product [Clonostachys byssicola]|uniref:Transcription factor tau subunit sfc1 n=1 Tax=Clonostachys byssicola TaxID=160290 RepID=A0A9N9U8Z3_9HYPO|nr:unnamed protein product [Clonostachys byssicola]
MEPSTVEADAEQQSPNSERGPSELASDEPGTRQGAPRYAIPARKLAAVEIPAVVQDVDRAVRAFGRVANLNHVLDPDNHSIPLFMNPDSPFCKPLMSHNAKSHNVVLKVTVPKRTGRKRKRGSEGPWQGDVDVVDSGEPPSSQGNVSSQARMDDPRLLKRKLQENVGNYEVEVAGIIEHSHRFRGLADFYWDMSSRSDFARRYIDQVLPGDVEKMKEFKFKPGIDQGPNVDVIPPPVFTHMSMPFNYFYSQNPYVRTTEDGNAFNAYAAQQIGYFIAAEDPTPQGPQVPPDMTDPRTVEVIAELEVAFEERPLWTRRALMNRLGGKLRNWNELKKYLNYVAYQFKGGPWRDGVVPYGLDPRTDPKYRIYQTLMFKLLSKHRSTRHLQSWHSLRPNQAGDMDTSQTHLFDGETYHTDGKVWQVCDITDPLLRKLLDNAAVRPTRDSNSGWYHGGMWAKVKAIMKTKLVAIQFKRHLTDRDFALTLRAGDETPVRSGGPSTYVVPLPNLYLTDKEITQLRGRLPSKKAKHKGYSVRFREPARDEDHTEEPSIADEGVAAENDNDWLQEMGSDNEEGSGSEDGSESENDSVAEDYSGFSIQHGMDEDEMTGSDKDD